MRRSTGSHSLPILLLSLSLPFVVRDALILREHEVSVEGNAIAVLLRTGLFRLLAILAPAFVGAGLKGRGMAGVGRVLEVSSLTAAVAAAAALLALAPLALAPLALALAAAVIAAPVAATLALVVVAGVALAVLPAVLVLAVALAAPRVRALALRVLLLASRLAGVRGVLPLPRAALAAVLVGVELQDVTCRENGSVSVHYAQGGSQDSREYEERQGKSDLPLRC